MIKEKNIVSSEYKQKTKISRGQITLLLTVYFLTLFSLGTYIKNAPEKKEIIVNKEILLNNKEITVFVENNEIHIMEKEDV